MKKDVWSKKRLYFWFWLSHYFILNCILSVLQKGKVKLVEFSFIGQADRSNHSGLWQTNGGSVSKLPQTCLCHSSPAISCYLSVNMC